MRVKEGGMCECVRMRVGYVWCEDEGGWDVRVRMRVGYVRCEDEGGICKV